MGVNKGAYKKKKRQFVGNQHKKFNKQEPCKSRSGKKLCKTPSPRPNLKQASKPSPRCNQVTNNPSGYRLIDMETLSEGIQSFLSCKMCNGEVRLAETNVKGLGSKMLFQCMSCNPETVGHFNTSKIIKETKNVYEVNRRSVYSMRCIGQGLQGLAKFCGVMNMPQPVKHNTYDMINDQILQATKAAAYECTKEAVLEEIKETETTDLTVSGDGTWMRRGHTSLHGVCTVIGANTGKILDIETLSSFCHGCNSWKGPKTGQDYENWLHEHKVSGKCNKNHYGSAGNMEVEGIKKIFHRSEEKFGVRYTNYIGDGDTATYPALSESKPYGPNVAVVKEECVGHVQKRMYKRLTNLKQNNKSKTLSDGKKIGGKNRLTGTVIDQLCVYYGNAIRANSNDLPNMRKAIWAIWNHKASTDEKPRHHFCPQGAESWCTYQKAVAEGNVVNYKHKNTVPTAIMDFIKPIFDDLSSPILLQRCLKGKTQNANESYNSVLWSVCPKRGFAGRKVVELAAYEATLVYNKGNTSRSEVLQQLNIIPGNHFEKAMIEFDTLRVKKADKKAEMETLEARRARRRLRLQKEQMDKEVEGVTYAAGQF